jgi:hypothetical protein
MELIIKEQRRPRTWYYESGEYTSRNEENIFARIRGEFLPDPEEISLKRRMAQSTLPKNKRGLYRVQPDPITVALWNDWQARKSMD